MATRPRCSRPLQQLAEHVQEYSLSAGIFLEHWDIPLKISDFCSQVQLQQLPIFNDFYRLIWVTHQFIVGFEVPGPGFTTCCLARSGRDFTETERTLLAFVQPHLALLLAQASRQTTATTGPALAFGLTPREAVVWRCLAQRQPDQAIAHHCHISPRTVQVHLRNIHAKRGVDNRTAAALAFNN